jgi:hypothetical protein
MYRILPRTENLGRALGFDRYLSRHSTPFGLTWSEIRCGRSYAKTLSAPREKPNECRQNKGIRTED